MMLARLAILALVVEVAPACGAFKGLRSSTETEQTDSTESSTASKPAEEAPEVERKPSLALSGKHVGDPQGEPLGLGGDVCGKAHDQSLWTDQSASIRLAAYVSTPECMTRMLSYDRATGEIATNDCLNVPIDYAGEPPMQKTALPAEMRVKLESALKRLRGWRLPAGCCEAVELRRLNPNGLSGARSVKVTSDAPKAKPQFFTMSVDFDRVDAGEDCTLLYIGEAEAFQALEREIRSFAPGVPRAAE